MAIIKECGDTRLTLDVKNKAVAGSLEDASNEMEIRKVFDSLGRSY